MVGVRPVSPPVHVTPPYGVVPPDGDRVIVPSDPPKQDTLVWVKATVKAVAGWVMVTVPVAGHPFASAIVYV